MRFASKLSVACLIVFVLVFVALAVSPDGGLVAGLVAGLVYAASTALTVVVYRWIICPCTDNEAYEAK